MFSRIEFFLPDLDEIDQKCHNFSGSLIESVLHARRGWGGESMRHDSYGTRFTGSRRERKRRGFNRSLADNAVKRAVDVLVSATFLLLLAPVVILVAAAIKIDSRGPVFYRCRRVGRNGVDLSMLKFRKMHDGAAGAPLASSSDDRFTRLGAILARTKLDEVPQLWNVLRGQMSLVGPRPEDASFIALHREDYDRILSVRPGITGYCQLAFARESEILDPDDRERHYVERILPQKVAMDCLYVSHRSLAVDLRILCWTAMAVLLSKQVAVNRQSGRLGARAPRAAFGTVAVERTSA
jgi:lipopolysaccharide/colanic/teichoic acid biosynthesis glycosyltransferase